MTTLLRRPVLSKVSVATAPTVADRVTLDHHASRGFRNPWPSFRAFPASTGEFLSLAREVLITNPPPKPKPQDLPAVVTPMFPSFPDKLTATWLGHACILVEFPTRSDGERGPRILFDPVFSERCSFSQYLGPKRQTPPPLPLADLPPIDAVVISHNHYDHMDYATLKHIYSAQPQGSVHFFAPLGNASWFTKELGARPEDVSELDWWNSAVLKIEIDEKEHFIRLVATPAQHVSNRGLFDRMKSLWASWCLIELDGPDVASARPLSKFFFAGDTGYRNVPKGAVTEEGLSTNPAFKEIGASLGPFDLAALPIGAYSPRHAMSPMHSNPLDAAEIHRDIRSQRSFAMHYGTWILTNEPMQEPPRLLEKAKKALNIPRPDFTTISIGAHVSVVAAAK